MTNSFIRRRAWAIGLAVVAPVMALGSLPSIPAGITVADCADGCVEGGSTRRHAKPATWAVAPIWAWPPVKVGSTRTVALTVAGAMAPQSRLANRNSAGKMVWGQ